jgi:Flp pilus assembly pilin Flp
MGPPRASPLRDFQTAFTLRLFPDRQDLANRFLQGEEGQDLVEYALLLVFLALAAITVLPTLGNVVNNVFSQSASTLTTGS